MLALQRDFAYGLLNWFNLSTGRIRPDRAQDRFPWQICRVFIGKLFKQALYIDGDCVRIQSTAQTFEPATLHAEFIGCADGAAERVGAHAQGEACLVFQLPQQAGAGCARQGLGAKQLFRIMQRQRANSAALIQRCGKDTGQLVYFAARTAIEGGRHRARACR